MTWDYDEPIPIAVLISGSGSTLKNMLELIAAGQLDARIDGVIASRDCSGLEHAREHGVPWAVVKRGKPFDQQRFNYRITAQLDEWRPALVCFGGFLSKYEPPPHYRGKVINIHPALLPCFGGKGMYGDHVHEAVLEAGCKVTGCTVHFVDDGYDSGAIIAQRAVPVLEDDTAASLGARVRQAERELYPEVINMFSQRRVMLGPDNKVRIAPRDLKQLKTPGAGSA